MRKKLLILLMVFLCITLLILSGCGKSERDPNGISLYLKNLESYSAKAKMVIKNNKQKITHNMEQTYSKKIGYAITLDEDRKLVYKDEKIYVKDLKNGMNYTQDNEFDSTYRLSFISEYIKMLYTNEENEYSFEKVEDKELQLIHYIIPGTNRNIHKAVLYVTVNDKIPNKVIIYDIDGKESVEITYEDFKGDIEIDESLFNVEN